MLSNGRWYELSGISFKLISSFMSHETKISCLRGSHLKMGPGREGIGVGEGVGKFVPREGDISLSHISVLSPPGVSSI